MNRIAIIIVVMLAVASPALAHVGVGSTASFAAGVAHPLSGLDHMAVMIGGALGMMHVLVPFVEPGILASVVALGLMVALAVDLPVWLGAVMIAVFALLHGHAHGSEVAETVSGAEYMAGFALATATLHLIGIGFALAMARAQLRPVVRAAGAVCVLIGAGLYAGVI